MTVPFLVVRAGPITCALPIGSVVETMRPLHTEAIRTRWPFVRGLALIRGKPVPVLDLASLLRGGEPEAVSRFVTIRAEDRQVALAVGEVRGVIPIEAAALEALPSLFEGGAAGAIEAASRLDERLMVVLRASKLLPADVAGALPSNRGGA